MKNSRVKIINALESLPEEAWGWIVVAIITNIFPSGLGGFSPNSLIAIEELIKEAECYRSNYSE